MADERSPLESEIRRLIVAAGPMPVADYMRLCLTHPQHGYYLTSDPIGTSGDFITAPEISQMFGELIGVWMASVWKQMGAPENVRIVELGPGRGTMMVDALRAAKVVRDFHAAIVLHLVEISPILQRQQQERMETLGLPVLWHATLDDVPGGPSIVVANEFFDALPVHQAVKRADGWHERVIEISPSGDLSSESPTNRWRISAPRCRADCANRPTARSTNGARTGWCSNLAAACAPTARRSSSTTATPVRAGRDPAGRGRPQARRPVALARLHRSHRPRRFPRARGERRNDRRAHPRPGSQRDFLRRLGIEKRAAALKTRVAPEKEAEIDSALSRLTATGTGGMGELFKVLAISDARLGQLPGFQP